MEGYDHEAAVANFLRARGVTSLPAACAARTQGSPSPGDRKLLWDRFLAQEAELEKKRRRVPKQSKPYFPDPSLIESAKKLGPDYSDEERRIAISSIVTMMTENIALGATFAAIAQNLIGNEIPYTAGYKWNPGFVQKFYRKHSRVQA